MSTQRRRLSGRQRRQENQRTRTGARRLQRKLFCGEKLESRSLMAADVNPFHNDNFPIDVNGDQQLAPNDVLPIINVLNEFGPGSVTNLAARMRNGAEAEGGSVMQMDVNNDGSVTSLDALMVINRLNGEGEGSPLNVRLEAVTLTGAAITGPVTTGTRFLVNGYVDDLRTAVPQTGVFAAYFDLVYPQANFSVDRRENQLVTVNGSPTGGTFTLTFNGETTAPITYSADDGNGNVLPSTTNLRTALEALNAIDPGDVEVSRPDSTSSAWTVRFGGKFANQNVPNMTGSGANLTGGANTSVTVTENPNVRVGFEAADLFRNSITFGDRYQNGKSANDGENGTPGIIDELGAFSGTSPLGGAERKLFTVQFTANAAGNVSFSLNKADESPGHDVLFYGTPEVKVDPTTIMFGSVNLTVVQLVDAKDDAPAAFQEDSVDNSINVLANDSVFTQGGSLRLVSVVNPANGTARIDNNGTPNNPADDVIRYTPNNDFFGTDSFTYTAGDGLGNTDLGTVTVTVNGVNDPPLIQFLNLPTLSTAEDTALVLSRANGNLPTFVDVDAGTANVLVTVTVTNGTVTLSPTTGVNVSGNGTNTFTVTGTVANINTLLNTATVTYQPTQNFNGSSNISLTINDQGNTGSGGPGGDTVNAAITVTAVNDAPVNTVPAKQTITEDDTVTFSAANGNAISTADVDAGTSNVQVTLAVTNGVLTSPTTNGVTRTGDGTATVTLTGALAAVNTALSGVVYDPNPNFTGIDTLTVTTNDQGNTGSGGAKSDTDTIDVDVQPNQRPRARNDAMTVAEDSTAAVAANTINVLSNDVANPTHQVLLLSFTQPANGVVTLNDNGTPANKADDKLVFVPNSDFFGATSFTYTINDTLGTGNDSTATVNVTVTEVNDAPTAVNDAKSTNEDVPLTFSAADLTGNDSRGPNNEASQTLTVTQVAASSAGGTVSLNQNGTITYTPTQDFNGAFTFTYTVQDNGTTNGQADFKSATGTVTITVAAVNDAPVPVADTLTTAEDQAITVTAASLTANDSKGGGADESGQALTITAVQAVSGGTVSLASGNVTFTPTPDFFGTATFTYTVQDDGNPTASATGTVTVSVTPVNDVPVPTSDSRTAIKNVATTYAASSLTTNDAPGPANESNQTLTVTGVSNTSVNGGTVSLVNGIITYTPANNFTGADSFTYTVQDNGVTGNAADPKTATGTVNLNVLNFVPSNVSGFVYSDVNGNGTRDAGEPGLGGVSVLLTGSDFQQAAVNITKRTNPDGSYSFDNLPPGDYRVLEFQPLNVPDGHDQVGAGGTVEGNDEFRFVISIAGGVFGNNSNFGERVSSPEFAASVNPLLSNNTNNVLLDPNEMKNGIMFSFEDVVTSQLDWYLILDGWNGYTPVSLTLATDRKSGVLTVLNNQGQQQRTTITTASSRLQIRENGFGQAIVQVIGTPANFTFASAAPAGEGEHSEAVETAIQLAAAARLAANGDAPTNAADAVFAAGDWMSA